jgi:hypothetical protein
MFSQMSKIFSKLRMLPLPAQINVNGADGQTGGMISGASSSYAPADDPRTALFNKEYKESLRK